MASVNTFFTPIGTVDSENRRRYDRRINGEEFSQIVEAFHPPYPEESNHTLLSNYEDIQHSTDDPILSLPPELSDLIFSFLSPPALKAAQCTSRAWWSKISHSKWILASVLEGTPNSSASCRKLLKSLDWRCDSALSEGECLQRRGAKGSRRLGAPCYSASYDAGRIRFRVNTFHISAASLESYPENSARAEPIRIHIKAFPSSAFLIIEAVIHEKDAVSMSKTRVLLIYQFRPEHWLNHKRPIGEHPINYDLTMDHRLVYGGLIYVENLEGPLDVGVTEIRLHEAWIVHIRNKTMSGSTTRLYSMHTKSSFCNKDARFELKPVVTGTENLKNHETSVSITHQEPSSQGSASPDKWNLIAEIDLQGESPQDKSNAGSTQFFFMDGVIRYHISRKATSGDLALVYEKSQNRSKVQAQPTANSHYQPLVLLSRPTTRSLLQNIAIGTRTVHYPYGRYLRIAIIWSDWCDAAQANRRTLYLYELSQETIFQSFASSEDSSFRNVRRIYGRRMQSVPPALGGTHPCNLVSPMESDAASSDQQSAHLSGILLHDQKCFVWGPASSKDAQQIIVCKAFDLTLDDQARDQSHTISAAVETSECACALHDLAFRVVLPAPTSHNYHSTFSDRRFYAKSHAEKIGTVSEITSPARQQALDRMTEWQLERIRGMRRAGFTEWDIADLWFNARWSLHGLVRKPEVWQTAGESTAGRWEERQHSPNIATQDLRVKRFADAKRMRALARAHG